MEQYIRINDEGEAVLDYDELDTAARINFLNDADLAAAGIDLDLDDPDFTNAEKAEALNDAALVIFGNMTAYLETEDGEEVEINEATKQIFIEKIISKLAERYDVEVA